MSHWNWRAIRAIIRKDLKQVTQNQMVWLPMILVPLILQVIMPLGMVLMPRFVSADQLGLDEMQAFYQIIPAALQQTLAGLSLPQQWIMLAANYMFAPFFLIVPLMTASVIGADSFVGEKERKTLEGLLYSPLSDVEFFVAKVLTALVPALVISFSTFVLYGLVVNLGGYSIMQRIFFPTATWWPLVFWLGPATSVAALGVTVLISVRAKSFMQAQQLSGLLVLPVVFLMIGQISGLFFLGSTLIWIVGLVVWLIGLWLVWIGSHTFSRSELITRI